MSRRENNGEVCEREIRKSFMIENVKEKFRGRKKTRRGEDQ